MGTYYIEKDGKIALADTERGRLEATLRFMPQFAGLPILESSGVLYNGEIVTQEEFLARQLALAKEAKYKEANEGARVFLEGGEALFELEIPDEDSESPGNGAVSMNSGDEVEESGPTYKNSGDENDEAEKGEPPYKNSRDELDEVEQSGPPYKKYHIEATDGNIGKLTAYALAFITGQLGAEDVVYWNTKEDVTIALSQAQLSEVLTGLGMVQAQVWNVKFPAYLAQIEAAQTVEEVEAIAVDYNSPAPADFLWIGAESSENTNDNLAS